MCRYIPPSHMPPNHCCPEFPTNLLLIYFLCLSATEISLTQKRNCMCVGKNSHKNTIFKKKNTTGCLYHPSPWPQNMMDYLINSLQPLPCWVSCPCLTGEIRWSVQGHISSKLHRQDSNPEIQILYSLDFTTGYCFYTNLSWKWDFFFFQKGNIWVRFSPSFS